MSKQVETEKPATEEVETTEVAEETVESPASEGEESTDESLEASEASEETETEEGEEPKPEKPKKEGGFQRRVKKLTAKLSEKEEEAEFWREEVLRLRTESKTEKTTDSPKTGEPKPDDFEKHEDYVRALAKFEVQEENKKARQAERDAVLKAEFDKNQKSFKERIQKFATQHPDFDEVMDSVEDIKMTGAFMDALAESEMGPRLMYHLSKNPEEFERVASLPDHLGLKELGKLEAKLTPPTTKETKTTKAPKPIKPVKATGTANKDPNTMDFQEYKKWREESAKR